MRSRYETVPRTVSPKLLLAVLAQFGASASSQVPYRSKPLLFVHKAKVICHSFHCSSAQKRSYGSASVFVKSRIKITVECQKTLNRYWYAGRARHSVLKGPLDLSLKFFRFAQNLDTRVRVPTTQNNKNSEADKYLLRYFGTLEGTRTPDLLVRSQSLYPAELPARICVALFVL